MSARFRLKWPNDVLADGAKLAGILLQTEQLAETRAVVIGIGVNVVHAPEGLPYPATSLRGLGCETDAPSLFGALAGAWLDAHALWNEGRGFEAIRKSWLARAAGLGGPIRVVVGGTAARGTFESIDEHGQLLLRGADGSIRRVSAGDVHLGEAASALSEAASPRGEEAA